MNIKSDEEEFGEFMGSQYAIRDILYMYRELFAWRGLYEDFGWEDGTFDPFDYIDISDAGLSADDLRLLREGSAIKILCDILLAYGQGGYPDYKCYSMERTEEAYRAGRFHLVPELEAAVGLGMESVDALRGVSSKIYRNYIFSYFADLVEKNRPVGT